MELHLCLQITIERLASALRVGLLSHQTNKAPIVQTSLDTDTIFAGLPARLGFIYFKVYSHG